MKKTLTFCYTLHQMAYWATAAGALVFFMTVDKRIWINAKNGSERSRFRPAKIPFGAFRRIFLQSAARTPGTLLAYRSHTCSLRGIFVRVRATAKND